MLNTIFKLILAPLLILTFTACSETDEAPEQTNREVTITEIDPVAKASLANTTAAIQAQLEQQNFSANSSASPSRTAVVTAAEFSMADVIFTIGSDDLTDEEANPMVKNGAYQWFKLNVADAGKLSAEELAEFNAATPEQFNEAFVESYYDEASHIIATENPNPASLLYGGASTASAYGINRTPKRIFGFFFKMFNPMTYMTIMVNMVKTVMTWALAQMFKVMLLSGTMTKLMIRLAINFPILTSIMIHVLSEYWGITSRMVPYLKYDREFGELFMRLAYEQPNMAHFVFQNIDAPLYNAMTHSMLLSRETTERLSIMMNWYATSYLAIPSQANRYDAFTTLLFDTRNIITTDNNNSMSGHGDGSELANERFYYAMFKYPLSTAQFIKAMQQVDAITDEDMNGRTGHQTVIEFMDFIFLGAQTTDIYPVKSGLSADRIQGTYNIFAIAQGMLAGIEEFGFEAYLQNFIDFALLIPPERYLDYGQAFAMAGYTYYTQAIYEGEGQPTMMDFMGSLLSVLPALLESCEDSEKVTTFNNMMNTVQPYIDEFMQNGMPNMIMPNLADSNASVIIEGDANQTITTPLKQDAKVIPAPTALIDVINNFPVLWEKDYSNEGYKGSRISNDPYGYSWSEMPEFLADLNWMQIPYPNNFVASSYFDFIFSEGTVDMYVFIKQSETAFIQNTLEQYGLQEVSIAAEDPVKAVNQFGQGASFKVYKMTITPSQKLYVYDLILFNRLTGIAFDLSAAVPEDTLPTGAIPTEPVNNTPTVEPVEPPVEAENPPVFIGAEDGDSIDGQDPVVEPDPAPEEENMVVEPQPEPEPEPETTDILLTDVIQNLPTSWVKDYSNAQYTSHYLTNQNSRVWSSMSDFMSNLSWIEIPQYTNFSYTDTMHFNYETTIYFVTDSYYSEKTSFEFAIDQQRNLTSVDETITSLDTWGDEESFYVYKLTVPAGYDLGSLNWIESSTVGIAFDISALNN